MPFSFFFFNDTATTEIYTLSLHDALPISERRAANQQRMHMVHNVPIDQFLSQGLMEAQSLLILDLENCTRCDACVNARSEEHTSELQSRSDLVCRLLLEKKKKTIKQIALE